jgi:hypothetical protein
MGELGEVGLLKGGMSGSQRIVIAEGEQAQPWGNGADQPVSEERSEEKAQREKGWDWLYMQP